MTTEGTYPYAVGGVSSWCDLLIDGLTEFDWQILPIMAGESGQSKIFELPPHAELVGRIELWSEQPAAAALVDSRRTRHPPEPARQPGARADRLGGQRRDAAGGAAFGAGAGPTPCAAPSGALTPGGVPGALEEVLDEGHADAGPAPHLDAVEAARLYQTIYWIARAAGPRRPRPTCCTSRPRAGP